MQRLFKNITVSSWPIIFCSVSRINVLSKFCWSLTRVSTLILMKACSENINKRHNCLTVCDRQPQFGNKENSAFLFSADIQQHIMRPALKPLAHYPVVAFVSCAFLVVSFFLLLLVGISLSIIKPIYLVQLRATNTIAQTSIATELRFGVWGVCATR